MAKAGSSPARSHETSNERDLRRSVSRVRETHHRHVLPHLPIPSADQPMRLRTAPTPTLTTDVIVHATHKGRSEGRTNPCAMVAQEGVRLHDTLLHDISARASGEARNCTWERMRLLAARTGVGELDTRTWTSTWHQTKKSQHHVNHEAKSWVIVINGGPGLAPRRPETRGPRSGDRTGETSQWAAWTQ